jgi:two-component system sensor histidine kinase ChvG
VRIDVRDHGPGVPAAHRAHLFERFFQADPHHARVGRGLGLYISRQIVRQHAGELAAEFPAEGGSRFIVALPVRPDDALAQQPD